MYRTVEQRASKYQRCYVQTAELRWPKMIKCTFVEIFERKFYPTELPALKFLDLLVRGFLGTEGEKLFRNHKGSATPLPEVKILVVIKNSLLTLTHRLLSSELKSRW